MRNAAINQLIKRAKENENIILVTGDLGFGVLDSFQQQFPQRFINAGISEQNMASIAAGMALEGKTVFTYSIANFPTLRCLEQIRNDAAYHDANVKILAIGCGMAYGSLGMSHHATEDIAIMRALPNITVLTPGDLSEAEAAIDFACQEKGTCYIRLGKGREPRIHSEEERYDITKPVPIINGEKICILSSGGILDVAKAAAGQLHQYGYNAALYSIPMVKPLAEKAVMELAAQYKLLVTIEEHNILGGLGGAISEVIAQMTGDRATLLRCGIPDVYSSVVGSQDYLRDVYGISPEKIVQRIIQKAEELG